MSQLLSSLAVIPLYGWIGIGVICVLAWWFDHRHGTAHTGKGIDGAAMVAGVIAFFLFSPLANHSYGVFAVAVIGVALCTRIIILKGLGASPVQRSSRRGRSRGARSRSSARSSRGGGRW